MIYNSNRAGRQPDSKIKSTGRHGTDVRSGNTTNRHGETRIIPSGKKTRSVIVVNGRVKVG